jgi:hypothetical protein
MDFKEIREGQKLFGYSTSSLILFPSIRQQYCKWEKEGTLVLRQLNDTGARIQESVGKKKMPKMS